MSADPLKLGRELSGRIAKTLFIGTTPEVNIDELEEHAPARIARFHSERSDVTLTRPVGAVPWYLI